MKCIALILLFLNLTCSSQTEAYMQPNNAKKDTSKYVLPKIDNKPAIAHEISKCFVIGEFKSLVIFLRPYVDFAIKTQDKFGQEFMDIESLTEYGAIQKLTHIFKPLNYSHFKVLSGQNTTLENVFIVQLYFFENEDDFSVSIYFILDNSDVIKSIAII